MSERWATRAGFIAVVTGLCAERLFTSLDSILVKVRFVVLLDSYPSNIQPHCGQVILTLKPMKCFFRNA